MFDRITRILALLVFSATSSGVAVSASGGIRRAFVPNDGISSWVASPRIGDDGGAQQGVSCSPSKARCLYFIERGNLATGRRELQIMSVNSADALVSINNPGLPNPVPQTLARLESDAAGSSGNDMVGGVRWLDDDTIAFLASGVHQPSQLYTLEVNHARLTQLTSHPTPVVAFDISLDRSVVVFSAVVNPVRRAGEPAVAHNTGEIVQDFGQRYWHYVQFSGQPARRVANLLTDYILPISIAPTGDRVIVYDSPATFPSQWFTYQAVTTIYGRTSRTGDDGLVRPEGDTERHFGLFLPFLVDLRTLSARPLLETPAAGRVSWAPGGNRVAIERAYPLLPSCGDSRACEARASVSINSFVVLIADLDRHRVQQLDSDGVNVESVSWEGDDQISVRAFRLGGDTSGPNSMQFRLNSRGWERANLSAADPSTFPFSLQIVDRPDRAPEVEGTDSATGNRRVLVELNPQLDGVALQPVEAVSWDDNILGRMQANLIRPIGFISGQHYPTYISLYGRGNGWNGGLAQDTAGRGILTVQILCPTALADGVASTWDTASDARRTQTCIESAIDYVVAQGLADPQRIAIGGFSNSGMKVLEFLSHSEYQIAAATITESFAVTPTYYASAFGDSGLGMAEFDRDSPMGSGSFPLVGGEFAGDGLNLWFNRSAYFHLDRIRTPVRFEYHGLRVGNWDVHAILRRLHNPSEYIHIPDESHFPVLPFGQLAFREGVVDWLDFWLNRHEDPDPRKAEQYRRWRTMRHEWEPIRSQPRPPWRTWTSIPSSQAGSPRSPSGTSHP